MTEEVKMVHHGVETEIRIIIMTVFSEMEIMENVTFVTKEDISHGNVLVKGESLRS